MGNRRAGIRALVGFGVPTLLAVFLWIAPLAAQYTTASLGGTVVDPSGASVPDAKITVQNADTGFTQSVATGIDGAFLFSRLPVGSYRLTVEKAGFSTYVQEGIALNVNQAANQPVTLKVGKTAEAVTVSASAELVTTREAMVGQLIDQRRVLDMPLNGRREESLVFLAAGTVNVTSHASYCDVNCEGGVHPGEQRANVNGVGPNAVNYQLDGTSYNDTYINTNLPFPNPDAIQEFSLQSDNLSAEYGNAAAGTVNIVTKSGTNGLHGDLFEFLRNGNLNARNFFAPTQDTLKRNQYGGSVGGPIKKDKLFFFGTYQGTRIRTAPEGQIAFVPTAPERNGDFRDRLTSNITASPCPNPKPGDPLFDTGTVFDPSTATPFTCADGTIVTKENQFAFGGLPNVIGPLSTPSQFFLKYIPLPNVGFNELNYVGPRAVKNEDEVMGKVDYNRGKHQLSGRYFQTYFRQPPTIQKDNILALDSSGNHVRVQNVAVNHSYSASPTWLFNTWFGWELQTGGSLSGAPFGYPDAGVKVASPTPPELSTGVSGYFGFSTNHKGDFDRGDYTIRENLTHTKGAHELHFGGEVVRLKNHLTNEFLQSPEIDFSGQFSGDGLVDFMLGRSSYFQQGGGEFKLLHGTKPSFYVQDNWRVRPRLTVNAGLRWDPYLPYLEEKGRVVCFQAGVKSTRFHNAPPGMTFGGENHDAGCPRAGSDRNLGNIAPRLGFAYRLTPDGKTSLRGGAGYYYAPPETVGQNTFVDAAPFSPQFVFNNVDFQDPYGSAGVQNPFPAQYAPTIPGPDAQFPLPAAIYAVFQRDYHITLVTAWNLTLERQLGKDWVVRAAYVGNKGTYLYATSDQKPLRELNPAVYFPGALHDTNAEIQDRRLFRDFSTVGFISSSNNSHYNALQLTLERRFARGLSLLGNYTWGKGIDDYGWSNPFNRHFDFGLSDDDIHHSFKFSGVWQLPRANLTGIAGSLANGWELTSIVYWRGGFPFSVSDNGDDNSFSSVFRDRADYVTPGSAQLSSGRTHSQLIAEWFDTSKFQPNAIGTFGNSGKNILRAPRFFNTDVGLLKNTKITERLSAQFRAEFFNAFNNVNFDGPDNNVADKSSGTFGLITSAQDPRILQFALKLIF